MGNNLLRFVRRNINLVLHSGADASGVSSLWPRPRLL